MSPCADENYYQNMCLHAGVALIGTDENLRIKAFNAAAERIFGQNSREVNNKPLESIIDKYKQQEVYELFIRALNEGKISGFEFDFCNRNNQTLHLAMTISPIADAKGKRTGISLCIRDITLKTELVRDVAESQKMTALGSMAGAVAHHFNNLMGGIITTIDFALAGNDAPGWKRALETTANALTRANKLTHSLMAFAEGARADTSTENITQTTRGYVDSIQNMLADKNIVPQINLESVNAHFPVNQVLSILENIIDNACEAMPQGGKLKIKLLTGADNKEVLICVRDTGKGIEQKYLNRIYEPFFTTKHSDTRDRVEHAGLGLAVVHGIVKNLAGTVSISSSTRGTTCTIQLPIPP